MDTQLLLKILGLYMIVSGAAMLLRGKTFPLVVKDLFNHRAVMWVVGFFLIILGGALAFQSSVAVWVLLLGWIILLKGATYILFPEAFVWMFSKRGSLGVVLSGIVVAAIGLGLLLAGF